MCTAFDCLVITPDLNVHVDVAHNWQAKELTAFLEMLSLTQHVTQPEIISEIIKNCSNNSHVLFATVNRLTNLPVSLPLELISTLKGNDLLQYSLMTKFKALKMK